MRAKRFRASALLWQVMDLCSGGDFFDFLSYRGSVTEDEARALFLQASTCLTTRPAYSSSGGP
jgi:hypothetical protein